ncbi:hypothetical protein [Candidatus Palauibacter sp.]|uniref:hypothetical protein n=1 Tax=Candidatus Palauibacter sp. TaxID=3101350 RepID=UPI003B02DE13
MPDPPPSPAGPPVAASVAPGTASGAIAADAAELPRVKDVVESILKPGCVLHYRTLSDLYVEHRFELQFSPAAREASGRVGILLYGVSVTLKRPTSDAADAEMETLPKGLGIRAVCRIPVTCPFGSDYETSSGNCVGGLSSSTPIHVFVGPGPGSSPGGPGAPNPVTPVEPGEEGEEEDDDATCTDDQIAIANEYNDPVAWPCTHFKHSVIHWTGTHGHAKGFLTDSYSSGRSNVLTEVAALGVSGAGITSDWRCPEGNRRVKATGLTHVHGRAGDFWAPGFLDEPDGANATAEEEKVARALHAKFVRAAQAARGRFTAFGHDGTHKDHIHIFW